MTERGDDRSPQGIAARVRQLREALGISQKELAERAGLPAAQSVSEIERGGRELKAWEAVSVAAALHTAVDVLLGLRAAPAEPRVLWRRGSKARDRAREAQLLERAQRYFQLERWCNEPAAMPLPNVAFDPRSARYGDVAHLAEQMRRLFDLGSIPAASLVPTLEDTYGVKIFYEDMAADGDCSAASVRGAFGAAILMDASEAPWRRNFNFAHELFHLVTWNAVAAAWEESGARDGEPGWHERLESFANHFASHLLLPAESLSARFEARVANGEIGYMDMVDLARDFGVSTQALLYRLAGLGLLRQAEVKRVLEDPEFQRTDRATMHSRWTRPPVPFSERYRGLAVSAYQRGAIGKALLAQYLETTLAELRTLKLDASDVSQAAIAVA